MAVMQQQLPIVETTLQKCSNPLATNIIGPIFQLNEATGLDDVLIDQDNNVAVSQDLSANNNCDSTAHNEADCSNELRLIVFKK